MKFFITGINGQLGHDINLELLERGYTDIYAPTSKEVDITNKEAVENAIINYKPDIIFHCAAYTAVDKAEDDKDRCYNVNVIGTKNITECAKRINARLVYISTDYVFDGTKEGYYIEDDKTNPINYYGETKYLGEEEVRKYDNHIITRISWVFGINGKNFVKSMLNLAETRDNLNIVADQVGSPTYTKDLSKLLVDIAASDKRGTYHVTNDGYCSWYEFAKYIFESNDVRINVNPITTEEYPTRANRPHNSKMSKEKLINDGFEMLPSWQDAVDRYNKELKKIRKKED